MNAAARSRACEHIFEAEFEYVYRTLRRVGVNEVDAEDLTQEVFVVMWRRRADWDPERSLRPWLMAVALRVANDHRKRRDREVPGGVIDGPDDAPEAEQQLAAVRDRTLVRRALAALPDKQRTVLVLHDLDDVPMRDLATAMAVPLFTVYSRLRSARKAFARSVRRAQFLASAGAADPAALLAAARSSLAAAAAPSEEVRRRGLARLRALVASAPLGTAAFGDEPPLHGSAVGRASRAGRAMTLPVAAGAAAALVAFLVLIAQRPPAHRVGERGAAALALAPMRRPLTHGPRLLPPVPAGEGEVEPAVNTAPLARPPAEEAAAAAAPAVTGAEDARLGQGVVGYWRFDEPAGSTVARDLSGNGNHCLLRRLDPATDWTRGQRGGAIRLTGRGWVECPSSESLNERITTEMTISAWVMRTNERDNVRALVSRQRGSGNKDDFLLAFIADRELRLSGLTWERVGRPYPRVLARWMHLAAIHARDGLNRLFIDGVEVGRERGTAGNVAGGSSPMIIGGAINGPDATVIDQRFLGAMDELVIYDRALDDAEVAALAAGRHPPAASRRP